MATTTYPGIPADFKSRHKPSPALVERHSTTAQYDGGASFKAKAAAAIGRDIFDEYVAHRRAELGGKK